MGTPQVDKYGSSDLLEPDALESEELSELDFETLMASSGSSGSGGSSPGSTQVPKELAVKAPANEDPAMAAHLQRYADEVASGRTPPPDLIAVIKAAGLDPDAEIASRGIKGVQKEDPALAAHLARKAEYEKNGQPVPPDLLAAIEQAQGSGSSPSTGTSPSSRKSSSDTSSSSGTASSSGYDEYDEIDGIEVPEYMVDESEPGAGSTPSSGTVSSSGTKPSSGTVSSSDYEEIDDIEVPQYMVDEPESVAGTPASSGTASSSGTTSGSRGRTSSYGYGRGNGINVPIMAHVKDDDDDKKPTPKEREREFDFGSLRQGDIDVPTNT